MKKAWVFMTSVLLAGNLWAQDFESPHFTIEKLSDGVYAAIHKNGGYAISNAGIISLGHETLVFDCFLTPEAARDLKKAAEQLTGNSVTYVVNSHFHNDHIRGNQVFTEARIIATRRTRELIEQYESENLEWEKNNVGERLETAKRLAQEETDPWKLEDHKMWLGYYEGMEKSLSEYVITLPDSIIADSLAITGGERTAVLFSWGKGHTESDLVLWLPEERILFAADLLFVENHPWLGDGFVKDWMDYLNRLKQLNPRTIVPGHGPLATTGHMDELIRYMQTVFEIVNDALGKRIAEEKLASTPVPDAYGKWRLERFFAPNLVIQYRMRTE
jgi:cyclase